MLRLRQQIVSGKVGQGSPEVQIILEDGGVYPLIGRLALEDAKVDSATGSVILRAVFPNPEGVLIPGMYVNANLAQALIENATILPKTAVSLTPKGGAQVYVVNQENKIEVRDVKTSGMFNGQWVITEGLNTGDKVVVMGAAKVKPDQVVEVRILPPTNQIATPDESADGENTTEPAQAPQAPAPQRGQNSVIAPATSSTQTVTDSQSEAEAMADSADNTQ